MHLHTLWRQTTKNSCDSTLAFTLWHQNPKKSTIAFALWRQPKKTHRIYQHLHSLSGANLSKTHTNQHIYSFWSPDSQEIINTCNSPFGASLTNIQRNSTLAFASRAPKPKETHQHFHPPSGAKTREHAIINDFIHQPNKLHSYIAHTHTQILGCIT